MSSSTRSQKASVEQMGLLEKLGIYSNLAIVFANAFAAVFTGVFRGSERPPQYYKYIIYTALRTLIERMSARQLHAMEPSTEEQYAQLCKKMGMSPSSEVLEDRTTAYWIGSSSAEKIIINFHGGGYVLPAGYALIKFWWQIQDMLSKQGKDVAVLFFSYDLAPVARYPRQLQQAAEILQHVIHTLHKSPENIVLTGDSAGANLALSLLSHISHPHPSKTVPITPITLSNPLCGVVLISPWLDFSTTDQSFQSNACKDYITPVALHRFSEAFMGTPPPHNSNADFYNQAVMAPEEWWRDLQVQEVLIVAGKEEVLIDSIRKFAETLSRAKKEVTVLISEGEVHDEPFIALKLGYKEQGQQDRLIRSWLSSKL